jgi:hypothetical protein
VGQRLIAAFGAQIMRVRVTPLRPPLYEKRKFTINEIRQDWKFSEIEKRGLQFLLRGSERLQYEVWTRRPIRYKRAVRSVDDKISWVEFRDLINKQY